MPAKGESKAITEPVRDGAVQRVTPFQQMIRAMAADAEMATETAEYDGSDLNKMLTAETDEEIWDADELGTLNFQHLTGCEIAITDISVRVSANTADSDVQSVFQTPDGKQLYLLVKAYRTRVTGDEDRMLNLPGIGDEFTANTSARYIVGKLWAFYTRGRINPDTNTTLGVYVKGQKTQNGNTVIKLRPAAKQSVSATVA
jgi:hypothetical protein